MKKTNKFNKQVRFKVGDWVMRRDRPELGMAQVTKVDLWRSGSKRWQMVMTSQDDFDDCGTFSEYLEKVEPLLEWER